MMHLLWLELACWSWFSFVGTVGVEEQAPRLAIAEPDFSLSVVLTSGRTFSGTLDARTDAERLWLRFEYDGGQIRRPIDWDRIVSARFGGEEMTGETLHGMVELVRRELSAISTDSTTQKEIVLISTHATEPPLASPSVVPASAPRVVSLELDVRPAQWDEDAEIDGLEIRVYPLDAQGNIVPVRGTLTVDFQLARRGRNLRERPFLEAGHWAEAVRIDDFGYQGAVYRLEYQGVRPEDADRVRPHGFVHADLAVPGQGTFEAAEELFAGQLWQP